MQLETTKIDNGIYKAIVFTNNNHYMFEKIVMAMDFQEAEQKVKKFCYEWARRMNNGSN